MVNASLLTSAVAVLVVIGAIIAIVLNLNKNSIMSEQIVIIPSEYTVEFNIDWFNSVNKESTGYKTDGIVSVNDYGLSFMVNSLFNNITEMTTTFVKGFLYGNSSGITDGKNWSYNTCVGSYTPSFGINQIDQTSSSYLQLIENNATSCAGGLMYSINAFYADHIVCIKNKIIKWIQGDSYLLTVKDFTSLSTEINPSKDANMTLCNVKDSTTQSRRLGDKSYPTLSPNLKKTDHRDVWWKANNRNLGVNKHVCFLHGMGQSGGPSDQNMANYGSEYWGNIQSYVPGGAAYTHAIHVNTHERGWDNIQLQDTYYDYIKRYRCDVVFAHSMGNVILAALAQRGKPVTWYMTQGPLRGSWGASWADSVCSQWYNPIGATAYALGYCTSFGGGGNTAVKSLVVRNYHTRQNTCDFGGCPNSIADDTNNWYGGSHEVSASACCRTCGWFCLICAQQETCVDSGSYISQSSESVSLPYIKGRMCGSSSYGLGGVKGVGLAAISGLVGYGENSDGMVAMSSCAQSSSYRGGLLSNYASSNNYGPSINHQDGTCLSGDGAGGNQKPCTWIRNMITKGNGGVCPIPGYCGSP